MRALHVVTAVAGVTVGIAIAGCGGGSTMTVTAVKTVTTSPAALKPPCPHGHYSPDGNFAPLTCKIADPQALAFYGKLMPPLFRLGPYATPTQVLRAIRRSPYVTGPELCQAYKLAAFAEGWHFAYPFGAQLPMRNGGTATCP